MKTTSSVLAVLVTLWISQSSAGYPHWWKSIATGRSSCGHPGYFANPADCTRFYRCVDHSTVKKPLLVRYDFDCPHGTVFDQGDKVCVHPREGTCGGWGWENSAGWTPDKPSKGWGWKNSDGWTPAKPSKGWGLEPYAGWAPEVEPSKGWTPADIPENGWGWSPTRGPYGPGKGGWNYGYPFDYEGWGWGSPGQKFWSFTPERSYVIVYDTRGKKRSVPVAPKSLI